MNINIIDIIIIFLLKNDFLVAKKKSIFDDRQMEIEELTTIIKTDLSSLNQQIAKLQELGRQQRENYQTIKGHHIASHSSSVVVALQSKLANMSNHFKSVLEVRSEVNNYYIKYYTKITNIHFI
jgi:syntaxin 5